MHLKHHVVARTSASVEPGFDVPVLIEKNEEIGLKEYSRTHYSSKIQLRFPTNNKHFPHKLTENGRSIL